MTDKPDPIDDAITATEPEPTSMRWDYQNPETGEQMVIVVPLDFTLPQFEAAIVVLTQMRAQANQRRAKRPQLVVAKPGILGADGRPIQ